MKRDSSESRMGGPVNAGRDLRGHEVELSECARYTFCRECYISRRTRDAQWIFLKDCARKDEPPVGVGGIRNLLGHEATLELATWKTAALRPKWTCNICHMSCWTTAGFKRPCQ